MNDVTQALEALKIEKEYFDNAIRHPKYEDHFKTIRQALEQMQWQPIEKAEKIIYGYVVGAYSKKYPDDWLVAMAYKMNTGDWVDSRGNQITFEPTHFTDTPTPPSKEE